MRFSEHFKLGKTQIELDFVDIPLHTDIRLFVDPYGISREIDPWFAECNNQIVAYFQLLVDSIRAGDSTLGWKMLAHLGEPNDTRLGMSMGRPAGRGIGYEQANDLYNRLSKSKAVKTGKLQDLGDCELLIPGIGSDKISDMTINVIRQHLVSYTQEQCRLHGVPMMNVQAGPFWDVQSQNWINRYGNLPVYAGGRLILVPKAAVRYRLAEDHHEYYNDFVLEYLQAEHLKAGSSLVTMLKSGEKRVYKKDLKKNENYRLTKEFLLEFSDEHPEVLAEYKASLARKAQPLMDEDIEFARADFKAPDFQRLVNELAGIPSGGDAASRYHNFILGALQAIFYPNLRNGRKEQEIDEGRKRVDIVFNNGATKGFFLNLSFHHKILAPYVFAECKNYSSDVGNPEFDQLAGRLQQHRGRFGFLTVRRTDDVAKLLQRAKSFLNDQKYLLVLDDADICALLRFRAEKDFQSIDNHLQRKLDQLLM